MNRYFVSRCCLTKYFLLLTLLAVGIVSSEAQNEIKISGSVVDDSSSYAVAFASISYNGTGTLTDINGRFSLTISVLNKSDSILVSCIGYENKLIPVRSFESGSEQTVTLSQKIYELSPHDIPGLSSGKIVETAIGKIPEVFAADTFYQQGFYRQYHQENQEYVRLIEAVLTVESRVEKNKKSVKSKERVSIHQLRRSDNNEKNKEEHGDHLMDLLEENPVYHSTGTLLNLKALQLYRFYFDPKSAGSDSVYHIFYYSTDRSGDRYDRGEIFIDVIDFTILKFTKEEIKNNYALRKPRYSSEAPYRWEFLISTLAVEYRMIKGKMHTSSLMKTYTHELYDNKVQTKEFLVTEYFELTIQNVIEQERIQHGKDFSVFSNLYHRKYIYDASFWSKYPFPDFYFAKPENVMGDLKKNRTMDEQFRSN